MKLAWEVRRWANAGDEEDEKDESEAAMARDGG